MRGAMGDYGGCQNPRNQSIKRRAEFRHAGASAPQSTFLVVGYYAHARASGAAEVEAR